MAVEKTDNISYIGYVRDVNSIGKGRRPGFPRLTAGRREDQDQDLL